MTSDLAFESFGAGPLLVLQWETLTEAAEEAGISCPYGGVRSQDGNLNGLEVGRQAAANAEIRREALFAHGGDDADFSKGGRGEVTFAQLRRSALIQVDGEEIAELRRTSDDDPELAVNVFLEDNLFV